MAPLDTLLVDSSRVALIASVSLFAALIAFLAGRLLGRRGALRETAPAPEERADGEEEAREMRKSIWTLQNENKNLSTFLTLLPELARELNTHMDRRRIAPVLRSMLEQIFDPDQILIFYTTHRDEGLILVEAKGLSPECNRGRLFSFGEGRVGWVASNQISMDESDFQQKGRFVKTDLDSAIHPHFKVELAAPMAHKERTLGVITVGGMLRHPKNEKTMLRMVADLGSIALNNVFLFHQMDRMANSDGLTGLTNKRSFLARLADEILRAETQQEEFSLFIFDIDHFKHYNDTNGHLAGDEALKLTGRLLRENLREEDLPARYGGEEFIILLPKTPKNGAIIAAEKVRKVIQDYEYPKERSQPLGDLTISGGVASYPYDGRTTAELISAADEALYRAKRGGRNKVCVHEPRYLSEVEEPLEAVLAGKGSP